MHRVVTLAGRARRLTRADYAALAESAALAIAIEVALKAMPFARLLRWLERATAPSRVPLAAPDRVPRLAALAGAPYRLLPLPSTCLRRSLVLYAILRRRGHLARLRLGVTRNVDAFAAHAWVECAGMSTATGDAAYGRQNFMELPPLTRGAR
jgi:hypothetical protein